MTQRVQLRRGTAASATANNPILAAGELGVETDTGRVKAGNGTTAWVALPYMGAAEASAAVAALVDAAPGALDTLNELAAALGDDPNFATTVTNQLAAKVDKATLTTDGDLLGRAAGVPARITRAALAADPAFSATYVPVADLRWLNPALGDIKRNTLARYWGKLKAVDAAPVDIVVLGTSISEGVGAGPGTRYLDRLTASLKARHNRIGVPGGSYVPAAYLASSMTGWTRTGGAFELFNYGLGLRDFKMAAAGDKMVITRTCTSFDLFYPKVSGGGSFSVKIGGGVPVTVNTANATTEDGHVYSSGDLGGTASRTITVEWVSGTARANGAYFYNGDETSGVRVWDAAHQGANLAMFNSYPAQYRNLATIGADLVIVELGANDLAALGRQASLTSIFTNIRTHAPDTSIVVVGMYQRTDDTALGWDALYADLLAAVNADGKVGFIDIYGRTQGRTMGRGDRFGLLTDTVHPNTDGHNFLGETVADYLDGASGASSTTVTPVTPVFAPTDISGLDLWLKGDAITGKVDADLMAQWDDSSGNARHVVQATSTKQPTYRTAVVNGKPAVRFDGGDALATSFTRNQPHTVFVVGATALATDQYFVDGTAVNTCRLRQVNATTLDMFAGAALQLTVPSSSAFKVMSAVFNTASSTLASNGVTATGAIGFANAAGVTLGAGGNQTTTFLTGDIAEVLVYNTALSTTDRRNVEAYLAAKYAIAVV